MRPSALLRLARDRLGASRRRAALSWAAATFLVLALLAGGPGISRDEAEVLARADSALRAGAPARAGDGARPRPPLAVHAAAGTRAALTPLGISHLRAARIATALFGALLSASLALLAWEISGPAAALLAPALFWAAPRHLHAGLVATPDLALAALTTATAVAWRRATCDPEARRRLRASVAAGVLFGAALATRADAWILLPALAAHAAASRVLGAAPARDGLARARSPLSPRPLPPQRGGRVGKLLRGIPPPLAAMVAIGPLVLLASWPSVAREGLRAFARGAPPSFVNAAAVAALTLPASSLLVFAAGVGLAVLRLLRAGRRRAPASSAPDDALLLLCAVSPFLAAAAGIAPQAPGVRPWLHAMPFLAALGARALLAAAEAAWPARAAPLAAALALLVLWPGVRAAVHFHPAGSSAWSELAGGAPGAATLGLPRQDGGEAAVAVLDALNARAREGSRVFWGSTAPAAVRSFARDGRLREDLAVAAEPEDADIAVVTLDGGSRDAEYRAWSAFRSARPVAGAYLDEVPLAFVYARPGSWQ